MSILLTSISQKAKTSWHILKFPNIINSVPSPAKDSPQGIKQSIFVAWEQVLDASAKANIQYATTKVTNMDCFGVHPVK
ncbi:hypothetical protein DWZ29_16730 [Anaerobutyricum hallii]|uniref:Uncharacterized protein n=1 Tax=Anaerobutyricum hallii TaxID=39488 RepID=A0A415TQZ5_9FIRM|nr:hypothetical protein DWZ29_16730 [Anaerobutyricum hallii]